MKVKITLCMWKFLTYFLYVLTVVFKAIVNKTVISLKLHSIVGRIKFVRYFLYENRKPVRNEDGGGGVSDDKVFQAE